MANPFCHIELNTDDVAKAKAFYRRIFKWKFANMKMGPGVVYTMIDVGKGAGGGIWTCPMPEAPKHQWLPYVEVDSVVKTVAKAAKAGATVVMPYQSLGEGMGALGVFIDPQGVQIGVWEAAKKVAKKPAKKVAKKAAKKVAKKVAKKK
jgi:predicted enzyme related to lactoylglutathione lyase